ncbi:hypothetical protein RJ639_035341 [Escallonia herrerae]|uniref:Uncharacterized protein n=1 Tax=Escallonia herrerae TaxID=1293975 RepID=A0AA89B686_9ASTE|nr:hypothetical protein RJ639_035341 [Escallonia herrerae]
MRSGLVVIGAVAFGYLSLQIGFKPYLEKAQSLVHTTPLQSDPSPPPPAYFDDAHAHSQIISDEVEGFSTRGDS